MLRFQRQIQASVTVRPSPGADGAGLFRAPAEAGVCHVPAAVQSAGGRPAAMQIRLLGCGAAVWPHAGRLQPELAFRLPPAARLP